MFVVKFFGERKVVLKKWGESGCFDAKTCNVKVKEDSGSRNRTIHCKKETTTVKMPMES